MRLSLAATSLAAAMATAAHGADYRISGPYTHSNLTIYLVHSQDQDQRKEKTYVPLDEALEHNLVVVYETSDVNTLLVANVSKDEVYLQSGDIVKGGKQDRVVKEDMILPPDSGKVPIAVFCVEHGRWTQRGGESAGHFESSKQSIAGNRMKLAVRADANQQEVWNQVAAAQGKLAKSVGAPVQSPQSATSFQLTLESAKVRENSKAYEEAFSPLIERYKDVVGYVVAVNGKVSSADVYSSHALFAKLWPKLLASAAVEAIGAGQAPAATPPSYDEVRTVVAGGPKDAKAEPAQKVNSRTEVKRKESAEGVSFETRDSSLAGGAVHRSYVAK
jgi:hypothetical protein